MKRVLEKIQRVTVSKVPAKKVEVQETIQQSFQPVQQQTNVNYSFSSIDDLDKSEEEPIVKVQAPVNNITYSCPQEANNMV